MVNSLSSHIREKFKNVRLLLTDVDGVLTKGDIIYDEKGRDIKCFNVKDGLGIRLLMDAGIDVGIITGRASKALAHRIRDLGITILYDGAKNKTEALDDILKKKGIAPTHCAFIGDDLPDLGVLQKVGLAITVKDAHDVVHSFSDYITSKNGGEGAVREIAEIILKTQKKWNDIVTQFSKS